MNNALVRGLNLLQRVRLDRTLVALLVVVPWTVRADDVPVVHTRSREIVIPFRPVNVAAGEAVMIRLYGSPDGGRTWDVVATRKPDEERFRIEAKQDGEFCFCIRSVDHRGRLSPSETLAPEVRYMIDTEAPKLAINAARTRDGLWRILVSTNDPSVDLQTIRLHSSVRGGETPEGVPVELSGTIYRDKEANIRRSAFPIRLQAGTLIRATARDRAGNVGHAERMIGTRGVAPVLEPARAEIRLTAGGEDGSPIGNGLVPPPDGDLSAPGPSSDVPQPVAADALGAPAPTSVTPVVSPDVEPARIPVVAGPLFQIQLNEDDPQPVDPPPAIPDDTNYQALLQAARNAVNLGNLDAASQRFKQYLTAKPEDTEIRREYAGILVTQELFERAAEQFQLILAQDETDMEAREELVKLLLRQDKLDEAQPQLEWLIRNVPDKPEYAIRMVELHVRRGNLAEASATFDKIVQPTIDMLDVENRKLLARLLLDMHRPAEAFVYFSALRKENPTDEQLLADSIVAAALGVGNESALREIEELPRVDPEEFTIRLDLAERLSERNRPRLAELVFRQVLAAVPDNRAARLGLADVYLDLEDIPAAGQILNTPGVPMQDFDHQLLRARMLSMTGDFAESIAICRGVLAEMPSHVDARIQLASAFRTSGQLDDSDRELRKALLLDKDAVDAKIGVAENHAVRRDFESAIAGYAELAKAQPHDIGLQVRLSEFMVETGRTGDVDPMLRDILAHTTYGPVERAHLRTALGNSLLADGRTIEAIAELQKARQLSNDSIPEARYLEYRAHGVLGDANAANAAIAADRNPLFPQRQDVMTVARKASEDCDSAMVVNLLGEAGDPGNPAATLLLAETLANCGCSVECQAPDQLYRSVLAASPTNSRARRGLARYLARERRFKEARIEYEMLRRQEPFNVQIEREYARVVHSVDGFRAARAIYQQAEMRNKTSDVVRVAQHTNVHPALLESDYAFADRVSRIIATESESKRLKDFRNQAAISSLEGVLSMEPTNEAAMFDLAQTYGALNRTHDAMSVYHRILAVNPCNVDAAIALERHRLETRPQFRFDYFHDDQDGFDNLVNVRANGYSLIGRMPMGDEDEFIDAGYRFVQYDFGRAEPLLDNNNAVVRGQYKFRPDLLGFANIEVAEYEYGFRTRPVFDAGLRWLTVEDLEITAAFHLDNVVQNAGAAFQDIHRWGGSIAVKYMPIRRWTVFGSLRISDYSDDNIGYEFNIENAYLFTQAPTQLRLVTDIDFMGFHASTFPTVGSAPITTLLHPYFSPDTFTFFTGGLEWKHWVSRDSYKGANQSWYQIFLGGRVDSRSEGYILFDVQANHDVTNRLTLGVTSGLVRSDVYDTTYASAFCLIRFP